MSDMLPRPEPREPFKRALRAQLMAQASSTLVRRETAWSRMQSGWLRPVVAFAAVALLVAAGTGKAAADSLPGDAAFGLKRAVEQLQLALAIDDTTQLRVLAEVADHRLAELTVAIEDHRSKATPLAQEAYADAIATLTQRVDALRAAPSVSQEQKNAAEDIVDAVHLQHSAVLEQLRRRSDDQRDVQRAKEASDQLHASDRPARTAEPSDTPEPSGQPDGNDTPRPTRTAGPARSPEHTRTAQPTRTPEPSETPEPTSSPETRTGDGDHEQRIATPTPTASIRR